MKRFRGLTAGSRGAFRRSTAASLVAAPVLVGAWLLLAAIPAMADGGPHIMDGNSGTSTLTADSCAGCHRAHTGQGSMILASVDDTALCVTCHGATTQGAATDVMTGLQYQTDVDSVRGGPLGALRSGGFDKARIASSSPRRVFRTGSPTNSYSKVSVGGAFDVTSAHLNLPDNGLTAPTKAWGNGAPNSGAGPSVTMACTTCHNPHGNGQYRILNPVPEPTGTGFVAVGSPGRPVTDAPLAFDVDGRERTKNYTVIQWSGTLGTFLLYADQVPLVAGYSPTAGDYWHLRVPWNNVPGSTPDAPNGQPALDPTGFNAQITAWCEACHSRYHGTTGSAQFPTSDPIFKYQHTTSGLLACTTCHVAHGSNASMDAEPTTPGLQGYSAGFPYPDNVYDPGPPSTNTSVSASSRLLKVDNRGTCQLCHDPTGTVANNTPTGPVPVPVVP